MVDDGDGFLVVTVAVKVVRTRLLALAQGMGAEAGGFNGLREADRPAGPGYRIWLRHTFTVKL